MAENNDNFTIDLEFDNEKFKESAKKVDQTISDLGLNIQKKMAGAFEAIGLAFGLDMAKDLVTNFAKVGSQAGFLSNTLNTNVSVLNTWGEAIKRQGGTAQEFYGTMRNIQNKMQSAVYGGDTQTQGLLHYLGITPTANGKIKDNITLLNEIGDALARQPRAGQQKFAGELGIDDATLRFLLQSNQARQEQLKQIQQIGVMTDAETRKAIEYQQHLQDIAQKWERIKFVIGEIVGMPFVNRLDSLLNNHSASGIAQNLAAIASPTGSTLIELAKSLYHHKNGAAAAPAGAPGSDYHSIFSNDLTPLEKAQALQESNGRNLNTGNGAYGMFQIRPHWFKKAAMAAHSSLGNMSEAQLAKWLMVPANNIAANRLMMQQDLRDQHGNLDAALKEYSGGNYGAAALYKKIPQSSSLQPGSASSPNNVNNNKTVAVNIHNLSLPHVKDGREMIHTLSSPSETGWAVSGGRIT